MNDSKKSKIKWWHWIGALIGLNILSNVFPAAMILWWIVFGLAILTLLKWVYDKIKNR